MGFGSVLSFVTHAASARFREKFNRSVFEIEQLSYGTVIVTEA